MLTSCQVRNLDTGIFKRWLLRHGSVQKVSAAGTFQVCEWFAQVQDLIDNYKTGPLNVEAIELQARFSYDEYRAQIENNNHSDTSSNNVMIASEFDDQ